MAAWRGHFKFEFDSVSIKNLCGRVCGVEPKLRGVKKEHGQNHASPSLCACGRVRLGVCVLVYILTLQREYTAHRNETNGYTVVLKWTVRI